MTQPSVPSSSGLAPNRGPSLMVLCFIFAEERLLLMRRGVAPYAGSWAPPGGYVEAGESPEAAVVRETAEEVGLTLDSQSLMPIGIVSLPTLNQVYVHFMVRLPAKPVVTAKPPEALDFRWFSQDEFPSNEVWEPFHGYDMKSLFIRARSPRLWFYQQCETYSRVVGEGETIRYLGRRS